ncbi:hypothetical protein HF650_19490 [Kosakonia sp. SMBL-WEM22]|uniref:hypothetical protein n=1 Tax=Kosakonia sp. SMBL-WEM22 TaxID=2725560 RepID=UPI00165A0734|nr:hypothetical protein [Kosakonia sp. SMBL-WEM22]QNQ21745.1 hypothetical protein HF650_19490 [Kosakonia sp. SMBL-WEM22]
MAKPAAKPLPDGAGAYPAYEWQSPLRNLCRMALALIRPGNGKARCEASAGWRWRLSGLRMAKHGA